MNRLSQTVKEFVQANQLLQLLMDDLSEILDEPLDAENAEWIAAIVDKVLINLDKQAVLEVETEYLSDVLERFPTWHPQIEQLREQHNLLHRQLVHMRRRIDHMKIKQVSREIRRQLRDWLDTYQELCRRESNLIHEALVLDVGEGE